MGREPTTLRGFPVNCSLTLLIARAYDLKPFQLSAPDWALGTRFEVTAKVEEGATKEQWRQMLQGLLAERFKLVIHRDQKEMQLYEMVVAKGGAKLKKSVPEPPKEGAAEVTPAALFGRDGRAELDKEGYPIIPKGCKSCMIVESEGSHGGRGCHCGRDRRSLFESTGQAGARRYGHRGKIRFRSDVGSDDGSSGCSGREYTARYRGCGTGLWANDDRGDSIAIRLKLELKKGMAEIFVVDHAEKTRTEN